MASWHSYNNSAYYYKNTIANEELYNYYKTVTNIVMMFPKQTVYDQLKLHTGSSFYINIENLNTK